MSETYECVCIVCHRKFQSRREYARLCSGRCKSELGNLRRQGIEALDRDIGDDLLDDYWDALRDLPLAQVQARAAVCIRTAKYFPKPRELRENPDGERRTANTSNPCVPDDDLAALVAEKNRIAAQMREAGTTPDEWREIAGGVKQRLLRMAMDARRRAGWPDGRGMVDVRP